MGRGLVGVGVGNTKFTKRHERREKRTSRRSCAADELLCVSRLSRPFASFVNHTYHIRNDSNRIAVPSRYAPG